MADFMLVGVVPFVVDVDGGILRKVAVEGAVVEFLDCGAVAGGAVFDCGVDAKVHAVEVLKARSNIFFQLSGGLAFHAEHDVDPAKVASDLLGRHAGKAFMEDVLSDVLIEGLDAASEDGLDPVLPKEVGKKRIGVSEDVVSFEDYGVYSFFAADLADVVYGGKGKLCV